MDRKRLISYLGAALLLAVMGVASVGCEPAPAGETTPTPTTEETPTVEETPTGEETPTVEETPTP